MKMAYSQYEWPHVSGASLYGKSAYHMFDKQGLVPRKVEIIIFIIIIIATMNVPGIKKGKKHL